MKANRGDVDPVGQSELRIQPDLWVFGSKKLFHKEFEYELGYFNAIQRDRVHVDIPLPAGTICVRDHHYFM
jgi:hypothetical protein